MISRFTTLAIASILLGACDTPTAPNAIETSQSFAAATQSADQQNDRTDGQQNDRTERQKNCTFSRGTTTCVTTVQYQETSSHSEYSGCLAGPSGVTGSRIRTFSDVYLVTVTTTTYRRGRSGRIYDTQTTTTRQLLSSTWCRMSASRFRNSTRKRRAAQSRPPDSPWPVVFCRGWPSVLATGSAGC